jgi:predicted nucleic acid-binding protein
MPWIIDTDIFIEAERGNAAFVGWLQSADGIATADRTSKISTPWGAPA